MTEFEMISRAHSIVLEKLNTTEQADERAELRELREALWAHLAFIQHAGAPALVFAIDYGYVTVGREGGNLVTLPHPRLAGLDDAWTVMINGIGANSSLHAADLVVGRQPANALRNRLSVAATWLDRIAHMPQLARALRRPCIEVAQGGEIIYRPSMHPPIRLTL